MVEKRFTVKEDTFNECISVTDTEDKLKNEFDSEFVLYPVEDASVLMRELNIQCAINKMLVEQLESYEDIQDIEYWIQEEREDYLDQEE